MTLCAWYHVASTSHISSHKHTPEFIVLCSVYTRHVKGGIVCKFVHGLLYKHKGAILQINSQNARVYCSHDYDFVIRFFEENSNAKLNQNCTAILVYSSRFALFWTS